MPTIPGATNGRCGALLPALALDTLLRVTPAARPGHHRHILIAVRDHR